MITEEEESGPLISLDFTDLPMFGEFLLGFGGVFLTAFFLNLKSLELLRTRFCLWICLDCLLLLNDADSFVPCA